MELIKLFILGATGYLLLGFYDLAIVRDKPLLRKFLFAGFFITSVPYLVVFLTWQSPLGAAMAWTLRILVFLFTLLLVYSVLLEIPLRAKIPGKLYREGTYGFSRHPGFIWYTVINLLIVIYYWDCGIVLLCAGFTVCNLALIVVEDMVLFPKMFPEYGEYRKHTPFFISLRYSKRRRSL
ncbi:MAG: hypothetical protein AB9828_01840 [Sphaerochaetaceae bacterium]